MDKAAPQLFFLSDQPEQERFAVMNIAYDHQFFSMFRYSGITRYFYEVISKLVIAQETKLSLFMGWHINDFDYAQYKNHYARFFSHRRPSIPKTTRMFNALNDSLFPMFLKRANPDLYHQTYYRYFAPSFKGRRVLTVYDMTYELFPEKFQKNVPVILEKKTSIDHADAIIAISNSTKNDLVRLGAASPEKITVVHLANSLVVEPRTKPDIGAPYLLYVGQRTHHKNFGVLLDAYCGSSRVHSEFNLVCFGGSPLTDDEKSRLASHGLGNRVHHRAGTDEQLAAYYANASLLVYPSLYEGFGLPLLEAMHYGCPVIASSSSSLPEIGGQAGIYFDPASADDLRTAMEKALSDTAGRKRMIEAGFAREKEFSWDTCAAQTLGVYKGLL